jgi:hypothetical protein
MSQQLSPSELPLRKMKKTTVYSYDDIEIYTKLGKDTIRNNKFYNILNYIMNHLVFRSFIDEYFSDWNDVKTTMMFIKTYQTVDRNIHLLERNSNKKFNNRDHLITGIIKNLIENSNTRKKIVDNMNNWVDGTISSEIKGQIMNISDPDFLV